MPTVSVLSAKARRLWTRFQNSRKRRGTFGSVRAALSWGAYLARFRYREWKFDRTLGVDTRGTEGPAVRQRILDRIEDETRDAVTGFGPSDPEFIERVLAKLPIRTEDFAFVDIGSGKGRVLLIASQRPFREVLGVELSRELHEVACRNVANRRGPPPRSPSVRSTAGDATVFSLPEGPVLLFLHNPFHQESLMERFLANVERSWKASPRPVLLAYVNPTLKHVFERFSLFEPIPFELDYCPLYATPETKELLRRRSPS